MAKEKPSTKICRHCKSEISYDAKVCPHCRKKQGGGIFKWIIIAIVVIFIFAAISGGESDSSGSSSTSTTTTAAIKKEETKKETERETEKEKEIIKYTAYSVDELATDLDDNALKASDKYKGQYVELTGLLKTIDSSGKYISLYPIYDDWSFTGVHCSIKNDETKQAVYDMNSNDIVTVRGKITDVGEILGYTLDIDEVVRNGGDSSASYDTGNDGDSSASYDTGYGEDIDPDTPYYSDEGDTMDVPHIMIENSSTEYLTDSDVYFYTPNQLRYAKNEIYARHGRRFNDAELQAWFDAQSWYSGTVAPEDFQESVLSAVEKANILVIQHRLEVNSQ